MGLSIFKVYVSINDNQHYVNYYVNEDIEIINDLGITKLFVKGEVNLAPEETSKIRFLGYR